MTTEDQMELDEYIASLGLTYTATFQPTPQPHATVKYPQLHWLITLAKADGLMQVTYREGVGHVKGYKQFHKTRYGQRIAEENYRKTCENGRLYQGEHLYPIGTQPAPLLRDVLYCLVMDASVLDYATYEEWAREFGYDEDSRKGEEIYRACIKQTLGLKKLIGFSALEQLQTLFQDY